MLNRPTSSFDPHGLAASAESALEGNKLNIEELFRALRRQFALIFALTFIGGVLAVAYVISAVPIYESTAKILIDGKQLNIGQEQSSRNASIVTDEAYVLSQIELLQSEKLILQAVENHDLEKEPLFAEEQEASFYQSMVESVVSVVRTFLSQPDAFVSEVDAELEAKNAVVGLIREELEVRLQPNTYVILVTYRSPSPQLTAKVTNAVAEAYILDQLESGFEATRRASEWLQVRSEELRKSAIDSELKVEKFRRENNLFTADGRLLSEQQLDELNTQLVLGRAQVAETQAKYDRLSQIISSGNLDASVDEALESQVIADFRAQFLEASKREADISARLGENHERANRLRKEMAELKRLIFDEQTRLLQVAESELQVAKEREKSISTSLRSIVGVNASANVDSVRLRELEREAETYRELHKLFLVRFNESIQNQSFPVTEGRIINFAKVEDDAASPNKPAILFLGLFAGGVIGLGIGAVRELQDRVFRLSEQVREKLGIECIGYFPELEIPFTKKNPRNSSILKYAADHPYSQATEVVRAMKLAIDLRAGSHFADRAVVFSMTSTLPGEGKTTISSNLAHLIALQGKRVLLIDADLRRRSLTNALLPDSRAGLVDVLMGTHTLQEALQKQSEKGPHILAAGSSQMQNPVSDLIASTAMAEMLEKARNFYDYIIVDLPPSEPVVDARAFLQLTDFFMLCVLWGQANRVAVATNFRSFGELREKCIGALFTRVDPHELRSYQSYGVGANSYGQSYYLE
ncbi:MAG: polysaccharide biosynthesis tyrosine autokinase [Pseudomonadota bacterium]